MSLTNNKWHVVKDCDSGFVGVGCTVSWTCLGIADVHHDVPSIEERVKVAELIASAPTLKKENEQLQATNKELLSALENLYKLTSCERGAMILSEYREAKQAITNAKQVMGDE